MNHVLDASALLALLLAETGGDLVEDAVADGAVISAVNLSEVARKLLDRDYQGILAGVQATVTVEPFGTADAIATAELYAVGKQHGLSLGDRACLALASRLKLPAMTADARWAKLDLEVNVTLIRGES